MMSGLWYLATLLDWTGIIVPALGVLARWYSGPLSGLTHLLVRLWDGFKNVGSPQPHQQVANTGRSVVVMLTRNIGGRVAVKSAYLLFYGVTGAVVLAVKLVTGGAYLGYCLARAGVRKIAAHDSGGNGDGDGDKEQQHQQDLEATESWVVLPRDTIQSDMAAVQSSGGEESLLVSSAFCHIPGNAAAAAAAAAAAEQGREMTLDEVPEDAEFVCYDLGDVADEAAADASVAEFERSLRADMPPTASLVEVPEDSARQFVARWSQISMPVPPGYKPTQHELDQVRAAAEERERVLSARAASSGGSVPLPSAPLCPVASSMMPQATLQEFLRECHRSPLPTAQGLADLEEPTAEVKTPEKEEHEEEDKEVDLVVELCPGLTTSQVVPGSENDSLLAGWTVVGKKPKQP